MASTFPAMWADPVARMKPADVKAALGGDIDAPYMENLCCVRVSHALTVAGMPITVASDFKDKDGYKYIIRVVTMKGYLESTVGPPRRIRSRSDAVGKQGVIVFDVPGWSDASGHADLWDGSACAYSAYWDEMSGAYLWEV